jgi:hypothetical protein
MCNAWNHSPGCTCGFGGDGHLGWGGGRWGRSVTCVVSLPVAGTHSTWRYQDDDFCAPTTCPRCGAQVFFVRHNGGSVWFDDLGPPWPKHSCFDDDLRAAQLRTRLVEKLPKSQNLIFGVVIETVVIEPGKSGRIRVKCSDGTITDDEFDTTHDLVGSVGSLVAIQHTADGEVWIHWL